MSDRDPFERIRQRREEEEQRLRRNRRRSMMMVLGLGVLLFVIRLAFPSGSAEENGGASSSLASSAVSSAPAAGTGTISQDGWNLILVNNENLLPQDFQVPLTTLVGSYRVDARTVDSAKAMIAAAAAEGIELQVCSAYRSVAQQERLYAAEDPVPEGQPVAVQAPGASIIRGWPWIWSARNIPAWTKALKTPRRLPGCRNTPGNMDISSATPGIRNPLPESFTSLGITALWGRHTQRRYGIWGFAWRNICRGSNPQGEAVRLCGQRISWRMGD